VKLSELLGEENVLLDFKARDKWEAIEKLVEGLIAHGRLKPSNRRQVLDALVARENVASTGMGLGIAIPHAWTDLLETGAAAVGIAPQGIPFQSADGNPATLIILLVSPRHSAQKHVRTLAAIARLLNYEEMRTALLNAKTPAEVVRVVKEEEDKEFG
jgi:mannitol/fructose-specific phosphotransferase system IIA component (Ntr-type)